MVISVVETVLLAAFAAGVLCITAWAWWKAKRTPKYQGVQDASTLIGRRGTATSDINPSGTVLVANERWSAVNVGSVPIARDDSVIVMDVEGLVLNVYNADVE